MSTFFARLFVKNWEKTGDPAVRRAYGTMVSVIGVIVNLLLASGKIIAGLLFSTVSVTADGLNNLSDAGSQLISLISFKISAKPADRGHPFGHARIEYVSSMIVSMIIVVIGVQLFRESLDKILHPETPDTNWVVIVVLAVSIAAKLFLFCLNRATGKRIGSSVMRATATDSLSDMAATGAVLLSTVLFLVTGINLDAWMGLAVSVMIVIAGLKIMNETKNSILGEAPSEEIVDRIRSVIAEYPEALGLHDLVVHNYGPGKVIASMHIEVDGAVDIYASHDMIDNIEKRLRADCGIEATIHMDPIVTDDTQARALREATEAAVRSIDDRIRIHDFRFVRGTTHSNLIFDVAVPFEVPLSEDEVKSAVSEKVGELGRGYCAVVTIDRI